MIDWKTDEFDDFSREGFEQKVREFSPKKAVSKFSNCSHQINSNSATIYSVGSFEYGWTVIVSYNTTSGDVTVSSGDYNRDLNVIVSPAAALDLID